MKFRTGLENSLDPVGTGTVPDLYLDFKTNMDPTWRCSIFFRLPRDFPTLLILRNDPAAHQDHCGR